MVLRAGYRLVLPVRRAPAAVDAVEAITGLSRAEERRKAVELITRVFPGSEVKTQGSSSLGQVIIKHNSTTVIAVKQRDLFSKYRWPAAPKILERLEMLKEDLED